MKETRWLQAAVFGLIGPSITLLGALGCGSDSEISPFNDLSGSWTGFYGYHSADLIVTLRISAADSLEGAVEVRGAYGTADDALIVSGQAAESGTVSFGGSDEIWTVTFVGTQSSNSTMAGFCRLRRSTGLLEVGNPGHEMEFTREE